MQCVRQRRRRTNTIVVEDYSMTLEEIGAIFGLTRQRVMQIEAAALRKLRLALRRELGELGTAEVIATLKGAFAAKKDPEPRGPGSVSSARNAGWRRRRDDVPVPTRAPVERDLGRLAELLRRQGKSDAEVARLLGAA